VRRRAAVLGAGLLLALAGCTSGGPPHSQDGAPTATAPVPSSSAPVSAPAPSGHRWQPAPGTSWQWQLSGTVDTGVDAAVYDVDGFDTGAAVVAALHAKGRKAVCYINAGAYESFRPDRSAYPAALLGSGNGWPGERWLDIRRLDVLRPILGKRFDLCRSKGFDAVEPDNVDGYRNDSGFPLTAADQLAFNRMVAALAHARGLAVGLKNDLDQLPQLVGDFDFAVNEQCAEYHECEQLSPFVQQHKAVFEAEYNLPTSAFCARSERLGLSAVRKHLDLDAWRQTC
jgi:hypothetical protein